MLLDEDLPAESRSDADAVVRRTSTDCFIWDSSRMHSEAFTTTSSTCRCNNVHNTIISSYLFQSFSRSVSCRPVRNVGVIQCWNWPKRTGGSDVEMFEILHRDGIEI